MTEKLNKIS